MGEDAGFQGFRRTHDWASLTRAEIGEAAVAGALPVLPIGAIEQHADHLPVGTDSICAGQVSLRAAEALAGPDLPHVLVLPTLPFGFSPHHKDWPGTLTLSAASILGIVTDIAESVMRSGFDRLLVVNGHGGNQGPLTTACTALASRGLAVGWVNYFDPGEEQWLSILPGGWRGVGHACAFETALVMALRPDEAGRIGARAEGLLARLAQPFAREAEDPVSRARVKFAPVFARDDNHRDCGYVGEPGLATPELGEALLAPLVSGLARSFAVFAGAGLRTGSG
jgi:creatinine amidohydrolase